MKTYRDEMLTKFQTNCNMWIKEYLQKLTEKYTCCSNCQKYSLTKSFKKTLKEEVRKGVLLHSDAGYGDDDQFGDVNYIVTYSVCPICKHEKEGDKLLTKVLKKYGRYSN